MMFNNQVGSIEALYGADADTASAVKAEYTYSAYGEIMMKSGDLADKNNITYSTRYQEANTGLLSYTYRHYSPRLKKWINKDPISEDGGINLYQMVGNDPVKNYDIFGMGTACCGDKEYNDKKECCIKGNVKTCCPKGIWKGTLNYYTLGLIGAFGVMEGNLSCSSNKDLQAYIGARLLGGGLILGFISGEADILIPNAKEKIDLKGKKGGLKDVSVEVLVLKKGYSETKSFESKGHQLKFNSGLTLPSLKKDKNKKIRIKTLGGSAASFRYKITLVQ